jgi:hypothetical protein
VFAAFSIFPGDGDVALDQRVDSWRNFTDLYEQQCIPWIVHYNDISMFFSLFRTFVTLIISSIKLLLPWITMVSCRAHLSMALRNGRFNIFRVGLPFVVR